MNIQLPQVVTAVDDENFTQLKSLLRQLGLKGVKVEEVHYAYDNRSGYDRSVGIMYTGKLGPALAKLRPALMRKGVSAGRLDFLKARNS